MKSVIVMRLLFLKCTRWSFVVLGVVFAALSFATEKSVRHIPQTPFTHEIHAVYRMSGQDIGSYDEKFNKAGTGESQTVVDSVLVFNRMGSKLEMKSSSRYIETPEGQLKFASGDVSSSQQSTHIEASVNSSSLQIKTETGGKAYERSVAQSQVLLGPAGARHLVLSRCHVPGDRVTYDTFLPELGTIITVTDVVLGSEELPTDEGRVMALKLEQTISAMPGKITLWLDRNGWLLRQSVPGPFGNIEAIRASAAMMKKHLQGATLPDEAFAQSIVKANVRLPQERFVDSIRLKIIHKQPELGWPNLETENQHVVEVNRNFVILQVKRLQPSGPQTLPIRNDPALAPYLSPNALLQSDDKGIQAIAKRVVGNEHDAWKAARALQQWTNENMNFDPGIAIAPASEVARNRRGTCFGYSMLLGALVRAAGIPSRLRMGFVYAGGIWGGHAWIDVRIGDDWIPLDGALYTPGPADAARFSFFTSPLEEGTMTGMGSLGQLLGHADIKILQYMVNGKLVDVPEGIAPFVIEKDTYLNPWLGFSIRKPRSFHFTDSQLAWPQTTVIAMRGPQGQKLDVANLSASVPTQTFDAQRRLRAEGFTGNQFTMQIAGKSGVGVSSVKKAGVVLIDGGAVWMITATAPDAKKLLTLVSSTITLGK